jgi:uncharacterized RDD family membrane protein YckC
MAWSDDIQIETPEQIDLSLEVAGLGSRFVARAYDWVVKYGFVVLIGLLGVLAIALLQAAGLTMNEAIAYSVGALLVVLFFAFFLGYEIYYEVRRNGQTPGKRLAGIRVVHENGGPVDFRSSAIRNLLALADFLPLFYMLGAFLIMVTKRGQRLGDLAAGTLVIRERVDQAPLELDQQIEELASPEFTFTAPQLDLCQQNARHILHSFFQRYPQMDKEPRRQLAVRLAGEFAAKTLFVLPEPINDSRQAVAFLASLYRDLGSVERHGR